MSDHASSTLFRSMEKLLLSAVVVLLWNAPVWASTIVDFTGPYAIANGTVTSFNCDGSASLLVSSVVLEGCNNLSNSTGSIEFTYFAHADGTVSFDWTYETFDDSGTAFFDPAFFVLNGVVTQLPIDGGAISQTGTRAFLVGSGDVFGFRQSTADNIGGRADLTIRSFEFAEADAAAVPEPTSMLLLGTGLVGMAGRRWRQRKAS